MSEPLMPRFAHIVRENPGAVRAATGAKGHIGNGFFSKFIDSPQA